MRGLLLRIGLRHHRARLAEAKTQLAKEPLALASLEAHAQFVLQVTRERLAIPNTAARQTGFTRSLTQSCLHSGQLGRAQAGRPARSLAFGQSGKARCFETMRPILHGARGVAQNPSGFPAAQTLRDQEHAVESVVVARFIRAANLIL